MATSQGYLDSLRAAHGAGMASVRGPDQRSADQANTVSGNPGLANNVGAYQAPRPPVSALAAWRLRQQQQQQNPGVYAGATQRSGSPMTNGSFGTDGVAGFMGQPTVDQMSYPAPMAQRDPRGLPPDIQYGDPRARPPIQTMAPQQQQQQMGSRDIMAGGGRYMFPRSTSAR